MSTRAEVLIKGDRNKIYLYHHFDGYYEGVGKKLVALLAGHLESIDDKCFLINRFINILRNHGFEITDCNHGDLEYVYVVDVGKKSIVGMPSIYAQKERRLLSYDCENNPGSVDMLAMFANNV